MASSKTARVPDRFSRNTQRESASLAAVACRPASGWSSAVILDVLMTVCEAGDQRRPNIVADHEAGTKSDIQLPVCGAGLDVSNPVEHLDHGRQQFAGRRIETIRRQFLSKSRRRNWLSSSASAWLVAPCRRVGVASFRIHLATANTRHNYFRKGISIPPESHYSVG